MQTYQSTLPLMPSGSLLSKKYSAISRPSLKLSDSSYSRIINHPQVILGITEVWDCSATSNDIIALSLHKGGIAFFDLKTGNEIGSRITTADRWGCRIAFSPDGKWIAIQGYHNYTLDLWNVETRTHFSGKTIERNATLFFKHITYSADGEKIMIVTESHGSLSPNRSVFIWDVKTDKPLKERVVRAVDVAISPDGSQLAIQDSDELGIKIIDVSTTSTGHINQRITPSNDILQNEHDPQADPRIVWSPNGQFLASATEKQSKTKLYLLSLARDSGQIPIQVLTGTRLNCPTTKRVSQLAFSPDSSKVVAILLDYKKKRRMLSIWCTRSGALVGTSHEMNIGFAELSFATDGQDILVCGRVPSSTPPRSTLYRFSVVPTHLETYMNDPPKFHPSQNPHTVQYSHHISGAIDDYAPHVSADGWILNTKGEREIWTPWANFELLCSCEPPQEGRTQYRTLEVKDPQTKTVVMIYVIAFKKKRM